MWGLTAAGAFQSSGPSPKSMIRLHLPSTKLEVSVRSTSIGFVSGWLYVGSRGILEYIVRFHCRLTYLVTELQPFPRAQHPGCTSWHCSGSSHRQTVTLQNGV